MSINLIPLSTVYLANADCLPRSEGGRKFTSRLGSVELGEVEGKICDDCSLFPSLVSVTTLIFSRVVVSLVRPELD